MAIKVKTSALNFPLVSATNLNELVRTFESVDEIL